MSWYFKVKPTIKTDAGIKTRSKRGAFVKNWWADRWIQAMEQVMDPGRLQRGRRYARQGQVLSVEIGKGHIVAKVQGSRRKPYNVTIDMQPLAGADWERVIGALAVRPFFVAQLLAGEMPQEIAEAFAAVQVNLFPNRRELSQSCSCPDWAEVCKHLAAVHYILAERFDEDPFLLFQLRGKLQAEIVARLGTVDSNERAEAVEYSPAPPLIESLNAFWQMESEQAQFRVHIALPETPYSVLQRLGAPDFLPEAQHCLEKAYDAIAETAVQRAFQDESDEEVTASASR